jgi:hypothetical protein
VPPRLPLLLITLTVALLASDVTATVAITFPRPATVAGTNAEVAVAATSGTAAAIRMGAKGLQLECREDATWEQIDGKKGADRVQKIPAQDRC